MIYEVIVFLSLFILTFLLLSKYKIGVVEAIANSLAILPVSHDSRLESLLEIANRYYFAKNYLAAEKAYLKVLKVDHKSSLAYSRLGFIYSHFGQVNDAIECFQIVADNYPNSASYYNLSMVLFKSRRFKRSAVALEKSISMEETSARLVTLARIYRVIGYYDKQIKTLARALHLEPASTSIMQLLAEAYLHEGQPKEAMSMFKSILKLEPANVRAKQALSSNPALKKLQ
ncbi:tetratricopeptide repeat protein [Candidatus Saccharibacteria bacterium]|nr:tetratricopeptide repeat protein [Candidatus Saccharibacteria bacterium]